MGWDPKPCPIREENHKRSSSLSNELDRAQRKADAITYPRLNGCELKTLNSCSLAWEIPTRRTDSDQASPEIHLEDTSGERITAHWWIKQGLRLTSKYTCWW